MDIRAYKESLSKKVLPIALLFLFIVNKVNAQKTVHYDLYIRDTTVKFTGIAKRAIAVNGQIPMPTLTFTEGDTAEIVV